MPITSSGLATSFITFSRPGATGGGATVTDADGKIKWAGHNLLTNSESFDAAAWAVASATSANPVVTANAAAAPNATTTADKIDFGAIDAAGDVSLIYQNFTSVAAAYTVSVWLKAVAAGDVGKKIWIYLNDGTIKGFASATLTADWQLLTTTATLVAGASGVNIGTLGSTFGGANQGAVSVYLWGAHLYRSDLGGMQQNPAMPAGMQSYYPTTPRNLLGYTEDFSNAAWTKTGVLAFGSGSVSNATVAPNGLQTADLLIENTANSTHEVNATYASITNTPYTFSVYAKAAGRNWCVVTTGVAGAWFNLSSGTVGTEQAGCNATISPVGNGWFLCRATVTETSGSGTRTPRIYIANADNVVTYTGDGTSGIYLWGAQLSDSASLDTYVPVYGAAVTSAAYYAPRLDFDGATLAAKGLLVEEARANLVRHSAAFDEAAVWIPTGATVSANSTMSPDGTSSADSLLETATTAVHRIYQAYTSTTGRATTWSCYVKQNGRSIVQFVCSATASVYVVEFDLSSVTTTNRSGSGTATITSIGNGWYRITATATSTASGTAYWELQMCSAANTTSYLGDVTKGVYLFGAQLEENASFATSYIPTAAATVTRNADLASVGVSQFPYSASEGTFIVSYLEGQNPIVSGGRILSDTVQLRLPLYQVNTTQLASYDDSGIVTFSSNSTVAGGLNKAATAWDSTTRYGCVNGGAVSTGSFDGNYNLTGVRFMSAHDGAAVKNGWLRQLTYIPRRLTNAELQSRTA